MKNKSKDPPKKKSISPIISIQNLEGKKQKLRPLERATHLQGFVEYQDGERKVGAILMNIGSSKTPDYRIRFVWECEGFHSTYDASEAQSIISAIASLNRELPLGESLRVEMHCFNDVEQRIEEYEKLFNRSPANLRPLIAESASKAIQLSESGQRRPRKVYLMATYTPKTGDVETDVLGKIIKFCYSNVPFLAEGKKHEKQEAFDRTLAKGYKQGFVGWENLFRDRLKCTTRALPADEVWQLCRSEFARFTDKKTTKEPIPQVIKYDFNSGKISEQINTNIHPVAVMLRNPAAVPSCKRATTVIGGKHIAGLLMLEQAGGFDATDQRSLEQAQVDYLCKFLQTRNAYDIKIVFEVKRPDDFGTKLNNQQLIREANYQKKGADAKGKVDILAEVNLEEAVEAERHLIGGQGVTEFAFAIFVYRDDQEGAEQAAREISSCFAKPTNIYHEVDTADLLWTTALPFYGRALTVDKWGDRRSKERPIMAAPYYPIVRTISNHKTGLEFIAIGDRSPVHFDPFKNMGHTAIWGKTRSGKSLLAAHVIAEGLMRGIPVTILDQPPTREASTFKDFVENVDGSYVDVFNDSLNFLETPEISLELDSTTRDDMRKQSEDFALQILGTMVLGAKGELPGVSSSKVTALLTAALKRFYNDNQIKLRYHQARQAGIGSIEWQMYPVLSDFIAFCSIERINLKEPTDMDVDTLSMIQTQLQRWIDGPYGKTINSPSTVALDKPLMAIAMRGVSSNDDAAVFGSIMYAAAMRRAIASANANGSLLFVDEASITFELDALSLCVGRIAANGLKAGMRLMLAAQEPSSVFNSAGGKKIKDAISYHLIGRIGSESFKDYCNPHMLNLPEDLAQQNAGESFAPDRATCSSQWLLKIADRFTAARIYLPPSLVALTANNIDERKARQDQKNLQKEAELCLRN